MIMIMMTTIVIMIKERRVNNKESYKKETLVVHWNFTHIDSED